MPKVVLVEQFYHPDGWAGAEFPRDITVDLARHGFEVEVVCGSDPYLKPAEAGGDDPRDAGVSIRHIPRLLAGDFKRLRLLRQLWFYAAAVPLLLLRRSPDLFVTQTNPPLVVPIAAAAAWLHRRPFVVIAQDLYPELVFAHGLLRPRSLLGRILRSLFARAYLRAERVVSLGPKMTERLIEKGVAAERITTISNWSTGARELVRGTENDLVKEWQLEDSFVVLYSGNLGLCHDVETPIRAIGALALEIPNLRLVFVGQGGRLDEARRLAASLGVEDSVRFEPHVAPSRLPHSFGTADLALVTLRGGFEGLNVPSKTLGYLARGIPVLYVGPDSDVRRLIETAGAGLWVDNGDLEGLASAVRRAVADPALLERMGRAGQRYYDQELRRALALESYRVMFETLTRPSAVERTRTA